MGVSDDSSKNVSANASPGTSDQQDPLTVSVGNGSPSGVQATRLGVSAASSASTNAGAATATTPTSITITTTNNNPAANHSFTLSGTLKAGTTSLSGKSITFQRVDSSHTWTVIVTTTTDTNGAYTFTRSESTSGPYTYFALFNGDTTYASSYRSVSLTVGTLTPTSLTITTTNNNPAANQSFTLSGTLKAGTTSLSGKSITFQRVDSSHTWTVIVTTTTDTNGAYTFTRSESTSGPYTYFALFNGDTTYASSYRSVSLTVGTLTPTSLTITTNNNNPAANQSFTLSGTLKAGTTSLSGKSITFQRVDSSGTWTVIGTTTTDTNGAYTFTRSESTSGPYTYFALFNGDTTYASSVAYSTLPIGNLQKSTLSVISTNNTPAVNQPYTLYGFLQDGVSGAHLAGQPINLTIRCPSGEYVYLDTTTDTNGAYTFTRSESAQGTYACWVTFRGSSSYFVSGIMCVVTVGNPIKTALSLNITNNNPDVNQSFTISGYLTAINGTKLSGRALTVYTFSEGTGDGDSGPRQMTTDSNGYYSVTISERI